jgi:hypothetical protein
MPADRLSLEVAAIYLDFVIMGALATILFIGTRLVRMGSRRDRGQPWALHAGYDNQIRRRRVDVRAAERQAVLDAEAAVREAEEIVSADFRTNL